MADPTQIDPAQIFLDEGEGEWWKGTGGVWVRCDCFIVMFPCCAVPWLKLDAPGDR